MGALGADAAIESADIVLMDDDMGKLPVAMAVAKKTTRIGRRTLPSPQREAAVLLLGAWAWPAWAWRCSRRGRGGAGPFSTPCGRINFENN
jgi:hypothetical protein